MSRFVIACPHFGHENIIKYESRPFPDAITMDARMVQKWNLVVGKNDTVFVLGDAVFRNKAMAEAVIKSLKGFKHLVAGNHDVRSDTWYKDVGFHTIYRYPIIVNGFFVLSHEPVYLNDHMPYVNIHGHLHSRKMAGDNYINVCVENTEYAPVLLDTIIDRYKTGEEKTCCTNGTL